MFNAVSSRRHINMVIHANHCPPVSDYVRHFRIIITNLYAICRMALLMSTRPCEYTSLCAPLR